jgi:hypothetical protein
MGAETSEESKELVELISQVRKGKARHFALLTKGTEVLGLLLSKRRISPGLITKKKKDTKAKTFVTGIAAGKGPTVTFHSTDDIKVKPAALRAWIKTETQINIKPVFETVASLDAIGKQVDTEEPSAPKPGKKPEAKAEKPEKTGKSDKPKPDPRKAKLTTALAAMAKTRADRIRANDKVAKLFKAISASLAKPDLDKAALDKAEKALRALDAATKGAAPEETS